MAPEETGQTAAAVGPAADLYALGAILYTLLAGEAPFAADDRLGWVHAHLAQTPDALDERRADVPQVLSRIVMRLLEKAPEARYSSAGALRRDLERCWQDWGTRAAIESFELDAGTDGRLALPARLYGRDHELATLRGALERVAAKGGRELVSLAGPTGVGKSALVPALGPDLARHGALLACGKAEEAAQRTPFAGLVAALNDGIARLLDERDTAELGAQAAAALHPNGRVLTDLVPAVERLVGPQPPAPELPLGDAQGRFSAVVRRLLAVIARQTPLVLVVDDLQWADAATVALLGEVLADEAIDGLLLVLTFREPGEHRDALEALHQRPRSCALALRPLDLEAVSALLGDALGRGAADTGPLATHLYRRSGGNPFFLRQLLSALVAEGVLRFDAVAARWTWRADRLGSAGGADVIDLTAERLRRLPGETRALLGAAACAGRPLPLALLARAAGVAPGPAAAPAVDERLVTLSGDLLRFAHDNVRAAAEQLVAPAERRGLHRRIADGLLDAPRDQLGPRVFAILEQLARAGDEPLDAAERLRRAELNLLAGRRAKGASAQAAAAGYLDAGLALVEDLDGADELRFALGLERAEVAAVRREIELAARLLATIAPRSPKDVADHAGVAMDFHMSRGALGEAAAAGVGAALRLGVDLDAAPGPERALAAFMRVEEAMAGREIESLLDLPAADDPLVAAQQRVLGDLFLPAYFCDPDLLLATSCESALLSIAHGTALQSPNAYVSLGTQLTARFGRPEEGHRWGRMALALAERQGDLAVRCSVEQLFGAMLVHPVAPIGDASPYAERAHRDAVQVGLLSVASYAAVFPAMFMVAYGMPLLEVRARSERGRHFVQAMSYTAMVDRVLCTERFVAALRGETAGLGRLDGPGFDLEGLETRMRTEHPPAVRLGYELMRCRAALLGGDAAAALEAAEAVEPLLPFAIGILDGCEGVYACALAYAGAIGHVDPPRDLQLRTALGAKLGELRAMAEHGPSFRPRVALIEAELARLDGDTVTAIERYDQAIHAAAELGATCDEALAAELAARYHRDAGRRTLLDVFARAARDAYARWQASAKVAALEAEFPSLVGGGADAAAAGAPAGPEQSLDAEAIIATSQAISASMVLGELLDTLLRVTLQHAGADAAVLLLVEDGELRVRAQAVASGGDVRVRIHEDGAAPALAAVVPQTVLERARQDLAPVVVQDARGEQPYAVDPYVEDRRPRSMLCLPLLRQGVLVGLLYLENRLITQAFTPTRLQVLELLGSQAAISLENARLYSEREYMADHDPLTGLVNRRRLDRELEHATAQVRPDQPATLLVLDLDNVKDINDSLGHAAGDQLIVSVAQLLAERVRETDVLARIGGDEFAILLRGAPPASALRFAEELRHLIDARTVLVGGRRVRVTASIGIAPVDAVEGGGQAALAAADGAMYEAKEDGRNRVAGYQAQQRDDAHARLTTVERLRTALEHDALALERQVVRDLRTGQDAFYELLVRLPAPDGAGLLPPSSFLPIAERTGLITQIDRWVIGRAVTLLTGRAHERTSLSVNLSGRSLADPGLPEFVAESLARAGADPSRLLFELTETAAIGNMDSAATLAAELRALGCRFALDDFGAGFGSFYYLKHLPLDVVKLDGDFIRDLARSPEDQLVVQAMVEIAHGLGLRTVAEYVGDAETEDLLREYGVDCAQGFFIGRPEALPPE